jgi:uncharacterized membrane protein
MNEGRRAQTPDSGADGERANRLFATVERIGARTGVVLIVVGFVLYAGGFVEPYVSIESLVSNWGLASDAFIRRTGLPTGWGWLGLLRYSDMLALGGLVLLTSVIVACYAALLVQWARQGNRAYLVLVALQLAVFLLAASGWLGSGH